MGPRGPTKVKQSTATPTKRIDQMRLSSDMQHSNTKKKKAHEKCACL